MPPHSIPELFSLRSDDAPASIALGTMNFGGRTSEPEAMRIMARAVERGVRVFDTANVYNGGESERIVGRALAAHPGWRERVVVATKVGFGRVGGKLEGLAPARVAAAFAESRDRLGLDVVDVYYLHTPDYATPIEATFGAVARLLEEGKLRAWGVSNFASWQVLDMLHLSDATKLPRPVVSQLLYNLLIRQLDVEYFKFTARHPIHTTVYNALAGGLLTDRHARGAPIPAGSRFDKNTLYQRRYWNDRTFEVVDAYKKVAADAGMSIVDLAYAWLARRHGVDSVLVGAGTVAQLDAALDGCAKSIDEDLCRRIDEIHVASLGTDATYAR